MRQKLDEDNKRSKIIGVKVKPRIAQQLKYLSEAEDIKISSYINILLETHIEETTKLKKINWDEELKEKE